jgi:hypothetical protein
VACDNSLDVYEIIEFLQATAFCSSWLGYTTISTATILAANNSTSSTYIVIIASASSGLTTDLTTTIPTIILSTGAITSPKSNLIVESDRISKLVSTTVVVTTPTPTVYSYSLYLNPNAKKIERNFQAKPSRKYSCQIKSSGTNIPQSLLR